MITIIIIGIISFSATFLCLHKYNQTSISIAISIFMGFLICLLSTVGIFLLEDSLIKSGTLKYDISIAETQELKPIQYTQDGEPIYLRVDLQERVYNCLTYKKDIGYSEKEFSSGLKISYTDDRNAKYTEPCLVEYKITYNSKAARLFLINMSNKCVAYIPREGVVFK